MHGTGLNPVNLIQVISLMAARIFACPRSIEIIIPYTPILPSITKFPNFSLTAVENCYYGV